MAPEHRIDPQPPGLTLDDSYSRGGMSADFYAQCAACGEDEQTAVDVDVVEDAEAYALDAGWHHVEATNGAGRAWVCPACWDKAVPDGA